MNRSSSATLDAVFKGFGAVMIAVAAVLSVGVVALTDPFGTLVTTTPAATGSLLFTALLTAVGYAAYTLRRR